MESNKTKCILQTSVKAEHCYCTVHDFVNAITVHGHGYQLCCRNGSPVLRSGNLEKSCASQTVRENEHTSKLTHPLLFTTEETKFIN